MGKSLAELLQTEEVDSPFGAIDVGTYSLKVENAVYEESHEVSRDDGTVVAISPTVRLQLRVTDADENGIAGPMDNQVAFVRMYIDSSRERPFGFVMKGYRALTGGSLLEGLDDYPTDDAIAQKFAASVIGGQVRAKIGQRKDRRNEAYNVVNKWVTEG